MPESKQDGGPALPPFHNAADQGLTLRDYLAAHAPVTISDALKHREDKGDKQISYQQILNTCALMRYGYADVMLLARRS